MGESAGGGSVTVAVGCWPRREGWGAEGAAAGGQEGWGAVKLLVLCSTASSINFNYLI